MFVCLCLTSKKPSEREFFVPAGTDLGVKLLKHVFDFAIKITLQALRFQPNRWHQSIQRKNLH
jgi:hypothetical protein